MLLAREPRIHPVAIDTLRPTQITVGMREVKAKRKSWRDNKSASGDDFLGTHMIPVIWGPKERYYVIDHHHLCLALHQENVKDIAVSVVADLRKLEKEHFWSFLDSRCWMHPFDTEGRRCSYSDLPEKIADLVDDPYRSLAGGLRLAGGYAKDTTPFSEFLWADFLRLHIGKKQINNDFAAALKESFKLAKSSSADYLPGWCGPVSNA